jgi:hypothetical protein
MAYLLIVNHFAFELLRHSLLCDACRDIAISKSPLGSSSISLKLTIVMDDAFFIEIQAMNFTAKSLEESTAASTRSTQNQQQLGLLEKTIEVFENPPAW